MTFKPKAAKTAIASAVPAHLATSVVSAQEPVTVAPPVLGASKFIRIAELATTKNKAGIFPASPASVWRWSRDPNSDFPKPFKLSDSITVWDRDAIDAFIAKRSSGATANLVK